MAYVQGGPLASCKLNYFTAEKTMDEISTSLQGSNISHSEVAIGR